MWNVVLARAFQNNPQFAATAQSQPNSLLGKIFTAWKTQQQPASPVAPAPNVQPPTGPYTFPNRNYMQTPGTPNPFMQAAPPAQPQGPGGTTPMNAILRGYFS